MRKYWLDITTVMRWHGTPVGVVRTELEFLRAMFNLHHESIGFCRYDLNNNSFKRVSHSDVIDVLSRFNSYAQSSLKKNHGYLSSGRRWKNNFECLLVGAIQVFPSRIHKKLWGFLSSRKKLFYQAIKDLIRLNQSLKNLWIGLPNGQINSEKKIDASSEEIFNHGDRYISMGSDWDDKNLVHLYELKKKYQLKVTLFCYDTIPVKFPQLCLKNVSSKFGLYLLNLAWAADRVMCISNSTRNDFENFLVHCGGPIPELNVIHLGCEIHDDGKVNVSDVKEEIFKLIRKPFLLYVSTIERRKNHEILYRAYTRLIDEGIESLPLLIFIGKIGWGVEDLLSDISLDPRVKDRIIFLNEVSDIELIYLYKKAYMTLFPSLYEGWGLPIAESLSYGQFSLVSNTSSMKEVGQNFVEYLDPWDLHSWVDRLRYYIQHPEAIEEKKATIVASYQPKSWTNFSDELMSKFIEV